MAAKSVSRCVSCDVVHNELRKTQKHIFQSLVAETARVKVLEDGFRSEEARNSLGSAAVR